MFQLIHRRLLGCFWVIGCIITCELQAGPILLFGSQLKVCNSLSPTDCLAEQFPAEVKTHPSTRLSPDAVTNFLNSLAVTQLDEGTQEKIAEILGSAVIKYNADTDLMKDEAAFINQLLTTLPRSLGAALHRYLDTIPNQTVFASLSLSDHIDSSFFLKQLSDALIRNKHTAKPKIGIITLGSPNPYMQANLFNQLFNQLGLNSTWLPLSAHLDSALKSKDCSTLETYRQQNGHFNVDFHYKNLAHQEHAVCEHIERLESQIEPLDALFFVEGDQNVIAHYLTNPTSMYHAYFNLIAKKFDSEEFIVAAEGNSIMALTGGQRYAFPTPMIRHGENSVGFKNTPSPSLDGQILIPDRVNYRPNGGLGLVKLGPIEAYFSEKERLARLAIIAATTRQKYALGLDANTTLIIQDNGNQNFRVFGQGGATVLDLNNAIVQFKNNTSQVIFQTSYLLNSDSFEWNKTSHDLFFNTSNETVSSAINSALPGYIRYRQNLNCAATSPTKFTYQDLNFLFAPDKFTQFFTNQYTSLCGFINLTIGIENSEF